MKILAIETSCDETSAAVILDGRKIISNVIATSMVLHNQTGGIIPEIAAREQVKYMIPVIREAIKPLGNSDIKQQSSYENTKSSSMAGLPAGIIARNIDALAVTVGPGLIGSLLVGVETAKTIAYVTGKPLFPVNHIFAHLYANWLGEKTPQFPALALVVSGGHTELFLVKSHEEISWIGGTRDDAAGEAFDKTARALGLGFPGGPAIAAAADKFNLLKSSQRVLSLVSPAPTRHARTPAAGLPDSCHPLRLPRPMIDSSEITFSFSGLKTAVMREVNRLKLIKQFNNFTISQLSFEIQEAITDVLVDKTLKAAGKYDVKSILLGGGVAANKRLTEKFNLEIKNYKLKINLFIPPPSLCTDNAAYIGSFAFFHQHPIPWQEVRAQPDLPVEVS
jgi:N6-L-threonylcarbamoyladenine synthase